MKTGGHKGILCVYLLSLPVRGAWIEILTSSFVLVASIASLPVRGAWIEMILLIRSRPPTTSLPVRGAWIEIVENITANDVPMGRSL